MDSKSRTATLQALAEYQKGGGFDLSGIAATLKNESDRGIVVIIGSLTEDLLLEQILTKFAPMSNSQRKNMTRSGGVLSSWADRTNMARALGIIDDAIMDDLEVMKAMRNACAHS